MKIHPMGETMKNINISKRFTLLAGLCLFLIADQGFAQYTVGESLDQQTRDKIVNYCSNESGSEALGSLLVPAQDESTRVVWLSFFASW